MKPVPKRLCAPIKKASKDNRALLVLEKALKAGSDNAAKALSNMTGAKTEYSPKPLQIRAIKDVLDFLNIYDTNTIILPTKIVGTDKSTIVLSASLDSILKLSSIFLHKDFSYFKSINSENASTIKEISDILAGYYVSELNRLLNSNYTIFSPPLLVNPYRVIEIDAHKTIEALDLMNGADHAMVFRTDYKIPKFDILLKDILLLRNKDSEKIIYGLATENTNENISAGQL